MHAIKQTTVGNILVANKLPCRLALATIGYLNYHVIIIYIDGLPVKMLLSFDHTDSQEHEQFLATVSYLPHTSVFVCLIHDNIDSFPCDIAPLSALLLPNPY